MSRYRLQLTDISFLLNLVFHFDEYARHRGADIE